MTNKTEMVSALLNLAERASGIATDRPEYLAFKKAITPAVVMDLIGLAAPTEDVREVVDEPEIVAIVESALRRSFTLGQPYWQQADSDSTCQQNKSDQTMEIQSNHITMVVKSIKSLVK